MPLSLLTILASRACHADTLKRALDNAANEDSDGARRLLALLGITPTHLADMRRGSAERLAKANPAPADIRTQAAFEQQLAEADEHVRVVEKRLVNAAAFEHEVAALLGVEYPCEVPDAIRALLNRAESAPTPDTIADLLALPDYVRVEVWPVGDSFNARAVRQADGAVNAASNTPREALIALYNHVTERVKPEATKPPEPIVLGPWRKWAHLPVWCRPIVGTKNDGIQVSIDGWLVADRSECRMRGEETGEEGKAAADKWARENGYVLLDAEPGSCKATLHPWWESCHGETRVSKHPEPRPKYVYLVLLSDKGHWEISGGPPQRLLAHGPQVGEEGKRYADAAAHALGLTGGGE